MSLTGALPGLRLLRGQPAGQLRADLVAGLVLAAYLLPAGIGDASLAGLPPQAGLYSCLFAGLVFWLFCSSRHTIATTTSAISLIVGTSVAGLAHGDAARHAALAATTALLVATIALVAWLVNAGSLVSFISETVMTGFKAGLALFLASTQLPKLFGVQGTHEGSFWERMHVFFVHLPQTNPASIALGAAALGLLLLGKWLLPNRPVTLFVLIGAIASVPVFGLASYHVALLGEVPQGLPVLGLPAMRLSDLDELLPLALACFLIGAVETAAISRMFARKHGYRVDINQELLGLAGSNLTAGLGRGFPVSGGSSQSLVNESAGARTPLSGLVAALLMLVVTLFLAGLLRDLPQPVLAAIVILAVTSLLKVAELQRIWQFSRTEFAIAMAAVAGVLSTGLLKGVLIGAVISLLLLVRRASRPRTTELGRVRGTDFWADFVRHPENERLPDVFVFRCEAALVYFNAEHVRDRFMEQLHARGGGVKLAVLFLGLCPAVDRAGAEVLEEVHHELRSRSIAFRLAEAHGDVRETLRRAGFDQRCAPVVPVQPVAAVIAAWRAAPGAVLPEQAVPR
ncbi:MAG TPA: SulP family inorganic anion transporter [Vicinamibacteria bacterium]|nr:SulP family inorganic anion transporter [Vicinamibacteria bacterium]